LVTVASRMFANTQWHMHGSIDLFEEDLAATEETRTVANKKRALLFFCPDVTDASTLKRVQQFTDHGYSVTVFGFRRQRYNSSYQPPWPHVPLGLTSDGRYGQRLSALLRAIPTILANRHLLKDASVFYARNIDQLLLAMLARIVAFSRAPLTYEVLDIPPILMRRGLVPGLIRAIERLCLRRTRMLVLSSPGFHRNFYDAVQHYRGEWFLLENKLHPSISRRAAALAPGGRRRPWVVGYFGLIRGEETFDLMTRLAERLQGRVLFKFRGVLTTVDSKKFDAVLRRCPNIVYGGPYLPHQDLEELYGDVDFAWALDLEHADHNSRWLMPCRFYEAGYFGVPCLAVRGFEVGTALEKHDIGWTFETPLEESLVRFFEQLTPEAYDHVRARLGAAPASMFVAGEDVARLCAMLR
jgi:succinoglycan biosynthesis protein ExoL